VASGVENSMTAYYALYLALNPAIRIDGLVIYGYTGVSGDSSQDKDTWL
jgi:hypothetical protein